MPCTEAQLFSFLDGIGIQHQTTRHPPLFTVEEARDWHDKIPGTSCKNLFLKDKTGQFWLVVMPAEKRADLKGIAQRIGAAKLYFAKSGEMLEVLGLTPGAVTPFALLNDTGRKIRVVLDQEMLECEYVNYHPLHNAASTTLRAKDLVKFIEALGYEPLIAECGHIQVANSV